MKLNDLGQLLNDKLFKNEDNMDKVDPGSISPSTEELPKTGNEEFDKSVWDNVRY